MHALILETILDADSCNKLAQIEYSTNPRKLVTVSDMVKRYEQITRLEKRVKELMGA